MRVSPGGAVGGVTLSTTQGDIFRAVTHWFEKSVLDLNLCPFAAQPFRAGGVYFELTSAQSDEGCLIDLFAQLLRMDQNPGIETLLLICPYHFEKFAHYNQFLDLADRLLDDQGWDGIYQIASFHPLYRFAGSKEEDRANWTNRSPFPVLHLIREASISRAVAAYPASRDIPARNLKTICALTDAEMDEIFVSHPGLADKQIRG